MPKIMDMISVRLEDRGLVPMEINRIVLQSACRFNHRVTAQHYIDLYEKMLQRPLINPENTESREMNKNSGKKGKRSINPIFTRD